MNLKRRFLPCCFALCSLIPHHRHVVYDPRAMLSFKLSFTRHKYTPVSCKCEWEQIPKTFYVPSQPRCCRWYSICASAAEQIGKNFHNAKHVKCVRCVGERLSFSQQTRIHKKENMSKHFLWFLSLCLLFVSIFLWNPPFSCFCLAPSFPPLSDVEVFILTSKLLKY